jgi:hypothetical protein
LVLSGTSVKVYLGWNLNSRSYYRAVVDLDEESVLSLVGLVELKWFSITSGLTHRLGRVSDGQFVVVIYDLQMVDGRKPSPLVVSR